MKRLIWLVAFLLVATPAFAQEPGGGGGGGDDGGFSGFFGNGDSFGDLGNRGRGDAPRVDRLVMLRDLLAKGNTPLTKDQEDALNELLDVETEAMRTAFEARFGQLPGAAGGERGAPGARGRGQRAEGAPEGQVQERGQRPGGRGQGQGQGRGTRGRGPAIDPNSPMAVEMRRMNEELLGKVIAGLNTDQQAVMKKWQNDQIRARGGFGALKLNMEEAGAPLTPEQIPQIEALFNEQEQARQQLRQQSPTPPDPAKITALEQQTMLKVVALLNPAQRRAMLAAMQKAQAAPKP